MEKEIPSLLKKIEEEKKITILFAVEAGSRAWELNSAESDYDVRFVFYRSLEDYISINKYDEQIDVGFDKDLNQIKREGAFIEMSGCDIFKYLKQLSTCNVTSIDWLNSNIVYYGNINKIKNYVENNFNRAKLFVQYFCTGRGSYKSHMASKDINIKKYLHVMLLILNAEYVLKYKKLPNSSMVKNLEELEKDIPSDIVQKIKELIELKIKGHGKDNIQEIPLLDKYFGETFDRYKSLGYEKKIKEEKGMDVDFFNQLLRKLLIKNE